MSLAAGHGAGAWPEEVDVRYYADSAYTVPGQGEQSAGCGEWYPREFCSACGEPHFGESRCQRRTCPECRGIWTAQRAEAMTARFAAARYVEDGIDRRLVHAAVSPPEGSVKSISDVKQGRREAYQRAREQGVRGGACVFHPFRVTEAAKREYREASEAGATEHGLWLWVLDNERDWRSQVYWSPHFHIIGLSREFAENRPEEQSGWVVERLSTLEDYRLTDREAYTSMAKCTRYVLSHAGFRPETSSHVVTWFGSLAYNSFSPEKAVSEGVLSTIERYAAEAVGAGAGEEESDQVGEAEQRARCEQDGCNGVLKPIWDAGGALLDPGWCEEIGREAERRLSVAFEWATGERQPPPGLKRPRSEGECREAFEALL